MYSSWLPAISQKIEKTSKENYVLIIPCAIIVVVLRQIYVQQLVASSSVARGGAGRGGGLEPPHWLVEYAKSHAFCAFEADFLWKTENSPPHLKTAPPQTSEFAKLHEIAASILVKTFFFFFFFFFFGDHLILGGKKVWISDSSQKITLNFGKDLFFFFLEIT